MKKTMIMILLTALTVTGCYTLGYKTKFDYRLGMDKKATVKLINNERLISFPHNENDDCYDVSKNISDKSGKYEILIAKAFDVNYSAFYIYTFKDGKLFYWGYPYEYTGSKKKILQEIGTAASDILDKYL